MATAALPGLEEARERRFWEAFRRLLWTSLILVLGLGLLVGLTLRLGWAPYLLMGFVGLLAGSAIGAAYLGSHRSREVMSLVLGAITLPVLAAYLVTLAANNQAAFNVYAVSLSPFLAYATAAVVAWLGLARVWRPRPGAEGPSPAEAHGHDAGTPSAGAAS